MKDNESSAHKKVIKDEWQDRPFNRGWNNEKNNWDTSG